MDKFLNLPQEKQKRIIDAALITFSKNGYKKTSVRDVALEAGISKAMVFHYFSTKKDLYFYLIDFSSKLVITEVSQAFDPSITDLFERIKLTSNIELALMKKHPAILSFLSSIYLEEDEEVKNELSNLTAQSEAFQSKNIYEGMDLTKFKDGVDPKLVIKMLNYVAEGFVARSKNLGVFNIDEFMKEYNQILDLLRNNFYKEEFL